MKTAMQQLLEQMREERSKLPIPIEWDRAYQSIEMMIQHTYIPLEKKQIGDAWFDGSYGGGEFMINWESADEYYNGIYGGDK